MVTVIHCLTCRLWYRRSFVSISMWFSMLDNQTFKTLVRFGGTHMQLCSKVEDESRKQLLVMVKPVWYLFFRLHFLQRWGHIGQCPHASWHGRLCQQWHSWWVEGGGKMKQEERRREEKRGEGRVGEAGEQRGRKGEREEERERWQSRGKGGGREGRGGGRDREKKEKRSVKQTGNYFLHVCIDIETTCIVNN